MNLATQSSASSANEIRESGGAFQSLIVWGKTLPLNECTIYHMRIEMRQSLVRGSKHLKADKNNRIPDLWHSAIQAADDRSSDRTANEGR